MSRRLLRASAAVFALAASGFAAGTAAEKAPWPGVDPGQYQVGYTVRHEYDHSRTFHRSIDYAGRRIEGEIARPLQISIWYPAKPAAGSEPIRYEEYLWADLTKADFGTPPLEACRGYVSDIASMMAMEWGVEREQLQAVTESLTGVMGDRARAFRDAPSVSGSFPVIIHMSGYNGSPRDHAELFEYLAGHGYIVAALPSMGLHSDEIDNEPLSVEVQARDMDFALAYLRGFPGADLNRVGTTGMSWGGMSNVLFAMENYRVDAVVTLDGAITMRDELKMIESLPGYDIKGFRPAYLQLMVAPDEAKFRPKDLRFFNSLLYSDAYMAQFHGVTHDDFGCSNRLRNAVSLDSAGSGYRDAFAARLFVYVLDFLDAYLKGDASRLTRLQSQPDRSADPLHTVALVEYKKASPAPPTQTEFAEIVRTAGADTAAAVYRRAIEIDPEVDLSLASPVMGPLYMEAFQAGRLDEALAICRLWQTGNPDDVGPLFSMARTYRQLADTSRAVDCYKKVLEKATEDRHRASAQKALGELGAAQ